MVPTIEINGRVFPVRFSVRVAIECAKEKGDVQELLFGTGDAARNMENSCYLLHKMLLAGRSWCQQEGEDIECPEIPSMEQMPDVITFGWLARNRARLAEIVLDEQQAEIGAEPPDGKN